jgi:hypothetical protein
MQPMFAPIHEWSTQKKPKEHNKKSWFTNLENK